MKNNTSWGFVADWYDDMLEEDQDSYQKNVLLTNLIRIVDPKPGMMIADIACGQGYFSRAYAGKGAKVIGSDISKELIDIAEKNSKDLAKGSIEFKVGKSDSLSFTGNNSVDVATITLALQNIENLSGSIAECSRILKDNGRLIITLNHPAFRIPKRSDWAWDDKNNKQYRRIDAYLSEDSIKIDMNPGEINPKKKNFTTSFHRPLQIYFKALTKAGFAVTRLEEWISHRKSEKGPRADEEDRMRKEIPLFMCIEAKKI